MVMEDVTSLSRDVDERRVDATTTFAVARRASKRGKKAADSRDADARRSIRERTHVHHDQVRVRCAMRRSLRVRRTNDETLRDAFVMRA